MRVSVASESGRPDRRNEDWAGATTGLAVLLDGLTEAGESGCAHGTPWYVHQLGTRLLTRTGDPDTPLPEALAAAISEVAAVHGKTCDLNHPGSPGSTVAMLRQRGPVVDYLVLSDSTVVLERTGRDTPVVITDRTVESMARDASVTAAQATEADGGQALADLIGHLQQVRNRPGGYWVAQADPVAARHAQTGTVEGVRRAALLSDGLSLLVTDFRVIDWLELLNLAVEHGPAELITVTRELEARDPDGAVWPRYKRSDDATAVICDFRPLPTRVPGVAPTLSAVDH